MQGLPDPLAPYMAILLRPLVALQPSQRVAWVTRDFR
jgi:hypothetical protein